MEKKELSQLTDQELIAEAKKQKSAAILNAFLIGFFVGIVVYSIAKNTWGFLTLIPLYFIYKLVNNSNHSSIEVNALLKERNLN